MAASTQLYAFSEDGEYLATSGPDGRLKIFETATGILKQEYVPKCHLKSACTSLSWAPRIKEEDVLSRPRKKLKKKNKNSAIEKLADKLKLLAMGTLTGKIVLYSFVKGDLQSEMSGGHSESVNCTCWNVDRNEMFSCSNDSLVVRWNFSNGTLSSKWNADKGAVNAMAVLPDGRTLLTSGRSIKFWDIQKQELLKKFHGHASKVFLLKLVNFPNKLSEESYFISGADGDRHLSAWHLKNDDKNSVASFSLSEDAICFDVAGPQLNDNKVTLAAVSKSGVVHLFEHHLNGKIRKPLQPKSTVQISYKTDSGACPAPIVACQMIAGDVILAYGSDVKMSFEKMSYLSCVDNVHLVRQDPLAGANKKHLAVNPNKVSVPIASENSRVTTPGYVARSNAKQSQGSKAKRKLSDTDDVSLLPMEKKLKGLQIGEPSAGPSSQEAFPTSENLTHLLVQGLHSGDKAILDKVLNTRHTEYVAKSVARLPVEHVGPLVRELCRRIQSQQTHPNHRSCFAFLTAILTSHASFLTTRQDLKSVLEPVQKIFETRSELLKKLFHLRGKMDFIVKQQDARNVKASSVKEHSSMIKYQDESSDDADSYIDDLLPSHSESEADNWNDFSDEDDAAIADDYEESGEAVVDNENEDGLEAGSDDQEDPNSSSNDESDDDIDED